MPLRILQLTNRIPWPLNDGGSIGIHYYIEGYLNAGSELSLLAMNTTRHWVDTASLPTIYNKLQSFKAITVDNRIKPLDAFLNLFKGTSYNIDRFISKEYEAALIAALQEHDYDIIHLDGLYVAPYINVIRRYSKAKVVMRLHNPEFRIWERLANKATGVKKQYLALLTKRLKQYELARMQDYDLILALSYEDAEFYKSLGCTTPVYIHPFGINLQSEIRNPKSEIRNPQSYHLGAMDWLPNQESVDWLLDKVWPLVIARKPDATLHLAGRAMPGRYLQGAWPGVIVAGEVPDAEAFEADKDILLVPLLSGGGVRIKIYRGMAAGKLVITTPVGVEGIEARDGIEVMIGDSAAAFAGKIIYALSNPEAINKIGSAARALIEEKYNSRRLMDDLMEKYQQLIGRVAS